MPMTPMKRFFREGDCTVYDVKKKKKSIGLKMFLFSDSIILTTQKVKFKEDIQLKRALMVEDLSDGQFECKFCYQD
jgi:hypothetical protein